MIVGIDASEVRAESGAAHLIHLLEAAQPERHDIDRICVWASRDTLSDLPDRPWLESLHDPLLERGAPQRIFWRHQRLPRWVRDGCDVLFELGGPPPRGFAPVVTLARDVRPFEDRGSVRENFSPAALGLLRLRFDQKRSLRRSDGVIFSTPYARDTIASKVEIDGSVAIVPNGVEDRFRHPPREQLPIEDYSISDPIRLLYVSVVDAHTHQWCVAEAVKRLRSRGLPVVLDFVGPAKRAPLERLRAALTRFDAGGTFLRYHRAAPSEDRPDLYANAHVFVFASSSESMPDVLLESMAAGLPIASSNRGPMPEILGEGGVYFDPENPDEIFEAIRGLLRNPELRARCARIAFQRAEAYSWDRCAAETLDFVHRVAERGETAAG